MSIDLDNQCLEFPKPTPSVGLGGMPEPIDDKGAEASQPGLFPLQHVHKVAQ